MRVDFFYGLAIVCVALGLTGCGPGIGSVSGVVTYQNKPVSGGTISFFDEHNGVESDALKEDGSYSIKKIKTGTAKIIISMPIAVSFPGMPAAKFTPIPDKYADEKTSGLTYLIQRGPQTHNITLE